MHRPHYVQNFEVYSLADQLLGNGNRLGKTPKRSLFASPGRVLGAVESSTASNDTPASVSQTSTDASLSEVPVEQQSNTGSGIAQQLLSSSENVIPSASQALGHTLASAPSPKSSQQSAEPLDKALTRVGWSAKVDSASGQIIYFTEFGSTFVRPVLPPGWTAHQAPDGRPYYNKLETKGTQWELPAISIGSNIAVPDTLSAPPGVSTASLQSSASSTDAQTAGYTTSVTPLYRHSQLLWHP